MDAFFQSSGKSFLYILDYVHCLNGANNFECIFSWRGSLNRSLIHSRF